MANTETDITKSPRRKKTITILILIAVLLLLVTVILFVIPPIIQDFVFVILLLLTFLDIITIIWLSTQSYNMGITFLLMIVAAIFFRRMRWPVTGMLFSIGFTGLACFSFILARTFLKRFDHNTFLKYIGFSSCIILSIVSMGLLWRNMRWPLAGVILNTGLVLFIPFLFAFVFTLPSSDYINWNKSERKIFFRAIIIPMAFVYALVVLMLVFPDVYTSITRTPLLPFNMKEVILFNMSGI